MLPCIPSRDHMVWKMLFEEFQEFCSVHRHLRYLIGKILASLFSMLPEATHQVSREYMVLNKLFEGFQNGWLGFGHLLYF